MNSYAPFRRAAPTWGPWSVSPLGERGDAAHRVNSLGNGCVLIDVGGDRSDRVSGESSGKNDHRRNDPGRRNAAIVDRAVTNLARGQHNHSPARRDHGTVSQHGDELTRPVVAVAVGAVVYGSSWPASVSASHRSYRCGDHARSMTSRW